MKQWKMMAVCLMTNLRSVYIITIKGSNICIKVFCLHIVIWDWNSVGFPRKRLQLAVGTSTGPSNVSNQVNLFVLQSDNT